MKKKFITFMLCSVVALSACSNTAYEPALCPPPADDYQEPDNAPLSNPTRITAAQAYEMFSPEAIILDVRNEDEYLTGHIKNAILLPVNDLQERANELLLDFEQLILIYCRSGNRSARAATYLAELGFTRVYDFGGIIDWPYEIIAQQCTTK